MEENYSKSVKDKGDRLIIQNKVVLLYPEPHEIPNEQKCYRFFIIPDKDGWLGNHVRYDIQRDIWTCTCKHWAIYGDVNCKHICACKMKLEVLNAGRRTDNTETGQDNITARNSSEKE